MKYHVCGRDYDLMSLSEKNYHLHLHPLKSGSEMARESLDRMKNSILNKKKEYKSQMKSDSK